MGTWETAIKGNDATLDIYSVFFDRYNLGENPVLISKDIVDDFQDYLNDYDDRHNTLFGLALAQWETKCLDPEVYSDVKKIIKNGDDLKLWRDLGVDEKTLKKRQQTLDRFLEQLSVERPKRKRRVKPKFEFSNKSLVKIVSPDNQKEFEITEEFDNNIYMHTSGLLNWPSGGSGIVYFEGQNKKISAKWRDNNTVIISHEKGLNFTKKEEKSNRRGEEVSFIYNEIT